MTCINCEGKCYPQLSLKGLPVTISRVSLLDMELS